MKAHNLEAATQHEKVKFSLISPECYPKVKSSV